MATSSVSFQFQHPTFQLRQRNAVRTWIQHCVDQEGGAIASLRFLFCDDDHVLQANRQFLEHDYLTDILTFPDHSAQGIAGDIMISVDRTRDNAKHLKNNAIDELHRVIAHGVLHLLGYNDHSPAEQKAMRQREDLWLSKRQF